jgi:hypothetical protein
MHVLDPQIEFILPEGGINTGRYQGHDGVRTFTDAYLDAFESFHIEVEDVSEKDDTLVAHVRIAARGRGSGAEVEVAPAHVWVFRGDVPVSLQVFPGRSNALK